MIVIGADTHKRSRALAALDSQIGVLIDELEITADEHGQLRAMGWAAGLDAELVWALEDCRHVAGRFERALIAAGRRVIRVPPGLAGASRRGERERGKSDRIDARAIARVVLREGIERFPAAVLDEDALEIRLLHDHRASLVAERGRQINRLRWHLVALCLELEAELPARSLRHERRRRPKAAALEPRKEGLHAQGRCVCRASSSSWTGMPSQRAVEVMSSERSGKRAAHEPGALRKR